MPHEALPTHILLRQRRAMATMFEAIVHGEDEEHLDAVASALFEEIDRVERLLSRFDRSSEVARINREAFDRAVKVDVELFALLWRCEHYTRLTQGHFDIALPSGTTMNEVKLDETARTIRFTTERVKLDMGGIGKGYALDRCEAILRQFQVKSALIHGGTSSVLALGSGAEGLGWPVGIRDPWGQSAQSEAGLVRLTHRHLSSSAALDAKHAMESNIVAAPASPLREQAACAVVANSGEEAEVFSTALLAMGRAAANDFASRQSDLRVLWLERVDERTQMTWLTEPLT